MSNNFRVPVIELLDFRIILISESFGIKPALLPGFFCNSLNTGKIVESLPL